MMSLIEIQRALKDRRIGLVAQYTGVHANTIREIRDNPLANPTHNVMLRLSNYLESTKS